MAGCKSSRLILPIVLVASVMISACSNPYLERFRAEFGWTEARMTEDGTISRVGNNITVVELGTWTVDSANRLCTEWTTPSIDVGEGCYRVSKRGNKIHLRYRSKQVIYEIME